MNQPGDGRGCPEEDGQRACLSEWPEPGMPYRVTCRRARPSRIRCLRTWPTPGRLRACVRAGWGPYARCGRPQVTGLLASAMVCTRSEATLNAVANYADIPPVIVFV